jgi:hypothetical protein
VDLSDQRTLVQEILFGDGMIPVGSMWRIKEDVRFEWDTALNTPVQFNKDGGNVDVATLVPGFVVIDVQDAIRNDGTFCFLISVLRLPTADDPPYKGKISFPERGVSWRVSTKYLSEWNYYFERLA